ncbi:MAG: DUF502 domain-containing protein [Alphaproteobacteria bacterium]|nr:DUF502 domain-containing protein [Alphaproteobacteria bacterium]
MVRIRADKATVTADKVRAKEAAELTEGLRRLAEEPKRPGSRLIARLRNYFFTGLIIVGPVGITIYIIWALMQFADASIKPFVPTAYLPETYLPFAVPGIGLLFGIIGVTIIGALTANLLGRSMVSAGELLLDRMPIVRNVYRALKQIFESVVSVTSPQQAFQKVGLIEFPSKGLWSIVFVTGETAGEIAAVEPGGNSDLLSVFMPTGVVPPTGFICFVPRKDVTFLNMTIEDAAKVIISAGMVTPDSEARLKELAAKQGLTVAPEDAAKTLSGQSPKQMANPD